MIFFLYPVPAEGAFHERRVTRGGERWPLGALDVAFAAEAQAAMIRLTGRGSPAEDNKKSRPVSSGPRCLSSGVVAEQAYKHRARNAEAFRRFVVRPISCAYSHCAWGHGLARKPGVPRALHFEGVSSGGLEYGRARAG